MCLINFKGVDGSKIEAIKIAAAKASSYEAFLASPGFVNINKLSFSKIKQPTHIIVSIYFICTSIIIDKIVIFSNFIFFVKLFF